jgi:hypothetical protein
VGALTRVNGDRTPDEWTLVRAQFDTLMRERSDNIEDLLDAQFRNRFSQLIIQVAKRENRTKGDPKPI